MNRSEELALSKHNRMFTKPAIELVTIDGNRFYVKYADGHIKWDYSIGNAADTIMLQRIAFQRA